MIHLHPTVSLAQLLWTELSHNLYIFSSTGLSPFEIYHGFHPPIFDHQEAEV